MALPSEVKALLKALDSLQTATTPTTLASCSRTVARAADDLELVCEETVDPSLCTQLNSYIERARQAVKTARKNARAAALKADRNALIQPPTIDQSEFQGSAERLAAEINDALRATAAVVSEEIQRVKVAGDVVEESTRRLRRTTDQHAVYADGIASGTSTLKSIRKTDLVANLVLALCFALFFIAAAYVTNRRIQNSNVATFLVRPAYKIVSLPLRITSWVFKSSFNKPKSQPRQPRYPSPSDPQHIKQREPIEQQEPRRTVEGELSDEGGHRSVSDKDAHGKNTLEEAQEMPHVSPSQHLEDQSEKDFAQHSRKPPSILEQTANDDKMSEDSDTVPVLGDDVRTEKTLIEERTNEDPETTTTIGDEGEIISSDPIDHAKFSSDVQPVAPLKSSPSSQYQIRDDGLNTALSQEMVQEMPSEAPVSSRLSAVTNDSRGLNQEPLVVSDEANVAHEVHNERQGLPGEKDLEALLYPLLSSRQFVPEEDFKREVSPTPAEQGESTPKRDREDETDVEQSHTVSSDSVDDDESAQPEPQGPSEVDESESLLVIPLPSQDESPQMDNVTDANGPDEVVKQNEPRPSKDKDYESRHSENGGKRTSETENQKKSENAKDMAYYSPQADSVTDIKSASGTEEQNEAQNSKGVGSEPPGPVTDGKGVSEIVEQSEPKAAKEKTKESLQSQNVSGRKGIIEAVKPEELQSMKDKGDDSLHSDNSTDRKGTSEKLEQREIQAKKDKEDVAGKEESPSILGDANPTDRKGTIGTVEQGELQAERDKEDVTDAEDSSAILGHAVVPEEREHVESRESSTGKWNEAPPDISFSSLSEASESEEKGIDTTTTRAAGKYSNEERDEDEPHEQLSFPASVVFEKKNVVEPEGMSEKRVQYDLSRICLVSGLDSDMLQICAVSAWTHL